MTLTDTGRWYCAVVRPGWVGLVERELYALGYRTFTPKLRKWTSHARRKRISSKPVMGRYLFVDIDHPRQAFGTVTQVMGVDRLISNGGNPCPFTVLRVTEFLRREMQGEWDDVSKTRYQPGMPVAIIEGAHRDKLAVITGVKGRKITVRLDGTRVYATVQECSVRAA